MLKYVVALLSGISLSGSVYMAGWGPCGNEECEFCDPAAGQTQVMSLDAMAVSKSTVLDMKNTKCIVRGEEMMVAGKAVEYKGKLYHVCCEDCIAPFNKDPEKFVKAFEANPAKFGVKK